MNLRVKGLVQLELREKNVIEGEYIFLNYYRIIVHLAQYILAEITQF